MDNPFSSNAYETFSTARSIRELIGDLGKPRASGHMVNEMVNTYLK